MISSFISQFCDFINDSELALFKILFPHGRNIAFGGNFVCDIIVLNCDH